MGFLVVLDLTRTGDRLVAVADDLDGVSIERFSCLGELDAPTPTLEQDDAESLLEKVDLLDERGRRYVECPRCLAEASRVRRFDK